MSRGLGDVYKRQEMMEMAKQKAQEIQKAWELIKEQRGF